jgi:hypothetical protein
VVRRKEDRKGGKEEKEVHVTLVTFISTVYSDLVA